METENQTYSSMDELLIKYLVGSATGQERNDAREWINKNLKNRKYFEELKTFYQLTKVVQDPSGFDKTEGWNRVAAGYYKAKYQTEKARENQSGKKIYWRMALMSAAACIAFVLGFLLKDYQTIYRHGMMKFNEISVPLGARSQVTLSDGTKVWLNAGSKLRYPVNFVDKTREVYLEGEAFFDVTKQKKRLFVVKTSDILVKVYGTQFNVKSYPEENIIQTTLVRGSVAIENMRKGYENQIVYLKPNQTATFYKEQKETASLQKEPSAKITEKKNNKTVPEKIEIIPNINPVPIISWKDNRWVIDGETLDQLAVNLERRYNVQIQFNDESLKKYKFSGTLTNETFEQVLKIVQISAPVLFVINSNHVLIKDDPSYKKNYDKLIMQTNY